MVKGSAGADSSVSINTLISGKSLVDLATATFGAKPVFWGRYFNSVAASGNVEYRHLKENRIFRANGIRVLPIARQTRRVHGTHADGSADAQKNAEDLIITFGASYLAGQGGRFLMFLDVEGSPSLSAAYYSGWAQTIMSHSQTFTGGAVTIFPCVYATRSDLATWNAVADTARQGILCKGAWVARWVHEGCHGLDEWKNDVVAPTVALPCDVLIWQYANDCHGGGGYDCNQSNPNIDLEHDLLRQLILPAADEI